MFQAASGAATLAGRVDGSDAPRYLPSLIADKVAGLTAAQAALAAYVHKIRTGEGQVVEVPMFEAFTQFMLLEHLGGHTFDPPNVAVGYVRQHDPDRQPFPTADGHISIVPYTNAAWATVFAVAESPEFIVRSEFATPRLMLENQALLYRRLAEITPNRTSADWVRRFTAARVPCMPVRDLKDITCDPHLAATNFFERRDHPTEGAYLHMTPVVRYSGADNDPTRCAPGLGEDGASIRAELAMLKAQTTAKRSRRDPDKR